MLKQRLLLKFTCLLLGSCNITPQSSVYVYTNGYPKASEMSTVTADVTPANAKSEKCIELELTELKAYALPPLPNLSKLNPNDDQSARIMLGALFDTLEIHRAEIKRLQAAYKCTLEGHR